MQQAQHGAHLAPAARRKLKEIKGRAARAAQDTQFLEQVDALTAALARAAPNMKALEQFDAVRVRAAGSRSTCSTAGSSVISP